jgi:hypothetical protein
MPIHYAIDPARAWITVEFRGALSSAEILGHFHTLRQDPAFDPSHRVLYDFRAVEALPSGQEVRALVVERRSLLGQERGKMAILAADDVQFGVGRMVETFSRLQGLPVRAFRCPMQAELWLETTAHPEDVA